MKITNTTTRDLGLGGDHVVPAGGSIEVPNDVLTRYKASAVVKGWFVGGALVEDGAVEVPTVTRESIAKMKRGNVVDLLVAHGVEESDIEGRYLPELRKMLVSLMFVDI